MDAENESRLIAMLEHSFGPDLWNILHQEDVNELMANPDGSLWIERFGVGLIRTDFALSSDKVASIIRLVASASDEQCDAKNPSVGAVLPGLQARFHGLVPPVVPQPAFSLRRRATRIYTLQSYIDDKIISLKHARLIQQAVLQRQNILVVGGTGSGKTTLANAILDIISQTNHRIITIEDTAELQCSAPNHLPIYVRPETGFDWQSAVKASLRLRPDRIVVGEVRDGSALDLLKAWNTGHNGGCATIHANSAVRGLTRLESLIREVSLSAPRELIAESINLLVHITRTNNGRLVDEVVRVKGIDDADKYIFLRE